MIAEQDPDVRQKLSGAVVRRLTFPTIGTCGELSRSFPELLPEGSRGT